MSDSNDPFGEFFHGKNDEELSKAMSALARMLWPYFHSLLEQGFDKATAVMLILEIQHNLWPRATT